MSPYSDEKLAELERLFRTLSLGEIDSLNQGADAIAAWRAERRSAREDVTEEVRKVFASVFESVYEAEIEIGSEIATDNIGDAIQAGIDAIAPLLRGEGGEAVYQWQEKPGTWCDINRKEYEAAQRGECTDERQICAGETRILYTAPQSGDSGIKRESRITPEQWKQALADGRAFADSAESIEEQMRYDAENACSTCGGSGHKDDIIPQPGERAGEAVAWMTHHDQPMLFLDRDEAASYCEDDETPVPLYSAPRTAEDAVPLRCNRPPPGWHCNLPRDHEGSCPTWPDEDAGK